MEAIYKLCLSPPTHRARPLGLLVFGKEQLLPASFLSNRDHSEAHPLPK